MIGLACYEGGDLPEKWTKQGRFLLAWNEGEARVNSKAISAGKRMALKGGSGKVLF